MPVLQKKKAALGWSFTKRSAMGSSREHKKLDTEGLRGNSRAEETFVSSDIPVSSPATPEPER